MADPTIGLIAGQGRLPILTAQGIRAAGREVACVGLTDQYDADLPEMCDRFAKARIARIGRWISLLRRWGAGEAVMIGRVRKARMYEPFRVLRHVPDWRAARLWYRVLRHDKRNAAMLGAVADELARNGITLIDSTKYIPEHLADEGVMTSRRPGASQMADIEFGWPLAKQLNELDIGQSIAVKDREVVAVEAIEGTDRMIARGGELCRMGGWTLIKTAKSDQDMRLDVPTVGPATIDNLKRAGASCLAIEAHRVIMLDKPQLLAAADRAGIAVVGVSAAGVAIT
ncbi:MAG: UDP-2,3-diacylglucosamine diphosphatase LpxI [Phycisphaeraceae bacterium]